MADNVFNQLLRIADAVFPMKMYPRAVGEPQEPNLVYGEQDDAKCVYQVDITPFAPLGKYLHLRRELEKARQIAAAHDEGGG